MNNIYIDVGNILSKETIIKNSGQIECNIINIICYFTRAIFEVCSAYDPRW